MVAASKLRRAQERVVATRPFARQATPGAGEHRRRAWTSTRIRCSRAGRRRDRGRPCSIVITADRGLCGSFNTNIIKASAGFIAREPRPARLARDSSAARAATSSAAAGSRALRAREPARRSSRFAEAEAIAAPAIEDFIEGKVDSVYLVYNEFKSVIAQKRRGRAAAAAGADRGGAGGRATAPTDYLYEPSPERIFDVLLQRLVQAQVLRALLESNAAFYAAQMTAMDAATRNSSRDDRQPDAVHEQDPPGGDHAGDHRGRVAARRRCSGRRAAASSESTPACGSRDTDMAVAEAVARRRSARSSRSSDRWSTSSSRADTCRPSTTRVRVTGDAGGSKVDIIVEVEQHLGENRVRTVAMKPTDGLQRGMTAEDLGRADLDAGRARARSAAC